MKSVKKDHSRIIKRILAGFATIVLVSAGAWGVNKLYSSGVFAPVDTQIKSGLKPDLRY